MTSRKTVWVNMNSATSGVVLVQVCVYTGLYQTGTCMLATLTLCAHVQQGYSDAFGSVCLSIRLLANIIESCFEQATYVAKAPDAKAQQMVCRVSIPCKDYC